MIDTVKDIAAFLGALATIGGFVFSIFKFIYKPISKLLKKFDELSGKVETLGNHDHDNYLSLLRLCLVSEEMPMSERLEAGRKYVAAGGNGAAKALYKVLLEKYENDLKNHRKDDSQ